MSDIGPVYSTGRGGAGNVVHQSAADEVVVPHETHSSFKQDEHGKFHYPTGRGGAGNVTELEAVPSPREDPAAIKEELSPVFSTGRGGAGNRVHVKDSSAIEPELEQQVSPVHMTESSQKKASLSADKTSGGIIGKLKKIFK
ncbi:hypothetical protein KL930_000948 [Ogataea haglerorum]|uniref:Uncharacterized protein n=1 Tax=Ogataea haglerorum TaxID=1937702 RepID=A0AAN6I3F6_9ASCO|nr:hypothetical protein KL914_000373 [Ogataea haglerorum]KAG7712504.1 hypothetical protein KL950_000375 [Ogataea haglerorum]KAG7730597.1 hypothetical protein KL933_000392 [Ogataea haglerorum]KAG7742775.1 hypothetical protein KL923_000390 [Ogataea haglerorum]KAG7745361.1 hypothetical protein KL932_000391 [Ogataea haglerorum]